MRKTLFFIFSFIFLNFSSYAYDLQYTPSVPDKINVNLSWKKLKTYLDYINELKENPKSPISNKYKNFFPSKVYFQDIKNNLKILPASSRITGDWQDHIDLKKNISSLKIKLKESNIGNIVRFRLLLPSSRNINEEIFISSLYEVLGYPSLFRKKVQVSINGILYENMIFEESPTKEFLERNGYRESPIIEFDERQFWFKLNKLAEICSDNYSSAIATKEFDICYENLANQFQKEFQTLQNWKVDNAAFLKNVISNYIGLEAIFFDKKSKIIKRFDNLSTELGLEHSIYDHNRKFIFDPIYKILVPFYYDGNVSEDKLKIYCNKNINNITKQKFKNFKTNKKKLVLIYKKRSKEDLNKTKNCVADIVLNNVENYFKKEHIFDTSFLNSKYSLINDQNPYTKKIYYNDKSSNFQICNLSKDCSNLSREKFSKILSGNSEGNIIENNIFFPEIIFNPNLNYQNIKLLKINNEDENLYIKKKETVYLNVSPSTKKLNLLLEDYTSKVVIFNSLLEDISVNLNFLETKNFKSSEIRYDKNLLTGCLSIIDSNLKNVNIYSNGANCEDAVNLIRSYGEIEKVLIQNSLSDAIDLDFSSIKINKTIIKNSVNDCIDFSGGANILIDVLLDGCGDKGISFGEKTLTVVNRLVSMRSDIDFSVKDDSDVKILNFISDKNMDQTCMRVENKKQEFGSGKLIINNIQNKCKLISDNEAIIVQNAKN